MYHFNPRTPCGVRLHAKHAEHTTSSYFNPRTPCGVRRRAYVAQRIGSFISIHAPRAGCDKATLQRSCADAAFQSTHPVRGATKFAEFKRQMQGKFQSTHPVRGATANMYNLVCSYFCNFTKSDVCLLTLYLFYHAISTENVVFSRFSAVRSAPNIHVCFRFAPCQSISNPSGA